MSQVTSAGVMLTPGAAKKTAAAVRQVLNTVSNGNGNRPGLPSPYQPFWAKLNGSNNASSPAYSWTAMQNSGGVFSSPASPISDTNYSAIEANGMGGLTGEIVKLEFAGYDTSTPPKPMYSFMGPLPTPQYQWMVLGAISQNQRGAFFTPAVSMI